jgi:5-methylcytosine-specific restriction protein A
VRKEFPARVKAAALKRCSDGDGIPRCETCGGPLRGGNTFYDHDTPDGLGGEPTLENCRVLCGPCHNAKTFGEDNPRMAKADAVRKKHYGITKKKRKIPGKRFNGDPIPGGWK